jgi:multicomponent Na+:H+ antiporter subunit B
MNSIILQIASRYVRWLLLLFALIALFRGHNYPGGGFIGGLLAGMSIVFNSFAYSAEQVRAQLKIPPSGLIAAGLLVVLLSMVPGILEQEVLMQGLWLTIRWPFSVTIKLGTPLLFDMGVFLTVTGVSLIFLLDLKPK